MNTQTINFLNTIKNASSSNNEMVSIPYNKFILKLLVVLYKEGFVQSFKVYQGGSSQKKIHIVLRYYYNKSSLKSLKIVSSPSKVKYLDYNSLTKISLKKSVLFLSTSFGVLTAIECKKKKIGGILFFIC
jgi:small subunit ribosomal protein S8